jgi:hypothetical protein
VRQFIEVPNASRMRAAKQAVLRTQLPMGNSRDDVKIQRSPDSDLDRRGFRCGFPVHIIVTRREPDGYESFRPSIIRGAEREYIPAGFALAFCGHLRHTGESWLAM